MSTSRVIVLEADKLYLPHLQKLLVCMVMKVVLRSLLITKKTRERKQQSTVKYINSRDTLTGTLAQHYSSITISCRNEFAYNK